MIWFSRVCSLIHHITWIANYHMVFIVYYNINQYTKNILNAHSNTNTNDTHLIEQGYNKLFIVLWILCDIICKIVTNC